MGKRKKSNPRCAIRIGMRTHPATSIAGDVLRDAWKTDIGPFRTCAEATAWLKKHPACGRRHTIAFVQWNRSVDMRTDVEMLCKCRKNLLPVLCAHSAIQGDAVVDVVEAGAADILGPREETFLRNQLRKIATGQETYQRFMRIALDRRKKLSAFGIMPYNDDILETWESGIRPTLNRIGVDLELAKDTPANLVLNDKVRQMIEDCDLVLADISLVEPICKRAPSNRCWGTHNPNVYYEIGYAHGIGRQVILLRSASTPGPTPQIPTDLQGIEWQLYHDMMHASLLVYHGLKP